MSRRGWSSWGAAAVALSSAVSASSACAYWGPPPPETVAPPWNEGEPDPDTRIAMRLLELLTRDRILSDDSIDVSVENGAVTLLGTVTDPKTRDRAVDLVESVKGVRAVYDRLSVERSTPDRGSDASGPDDP